MTEFLCLWQFLIVQHPQLSVEGRDGHGLGKLRVLEQFQLRALRQGDYPFHKASFFKATSTTALLCPIYFESALDCMTMRLWHGFV